MKKLISLSLLLFLSVQITSCKSEKKKEAKVSTEKKAAFSLSTAKNNLQWTAYKTTDKIPVKRRWKYGKRSNKQC
mgnify:CR=1 FL=1